MAAAAVSVDDELSCPICFEFFVDPHTPKNLPCGHVLCELCLKQMEVGQRTCPECRKIIKFPRDGIASFPTNYRLRTLAENHQKAGNDLPQAQESPKKAGVPMCPDHEDEKMHYFCITCNTLACQVCMNLKHKGPEHNIEGVKEICCKQKSELKSVIDQAKSKIKEAEEVLSECKAAETESSELHDIVGKQVYEHYEREANEILEQGQISKTQIERSKQLHASKLKQQTHSTEKLLNSFKTSYQAAVSANENLPDYEYITQHALLINKMEEINIRKLQSVAVNKPKQDVIIFDERQYTHRFYPIFSVTSEKQRTIKPIQTFDGFFQACRLDCISNGLFAVINRNKVVIYHKINEKYEKKFDLEPENDYQPYDVAIHPDGRFMVARGTCIAVYSPDGNRHDDIEIKGSGKVNVDCVKVTSNGRILVGDYQELLIVEISQTGNAIKIVHTSIKPNHMTLIHDTHIAISHPMAGKVIVIDIESGQETLSIDIPMVSGICYDEHTGCLLTARSEPADEPGMALTYTGVIEQYSYTTGGLRAYLQQGLYCPTGMALTSEGHLIVANGESVEIYEMQCKNILEF